MQRLLPFGRRSRTLAVGCLPVTSILGDVLTNGGPRGAVAIRYCLTRCQLHFATTELAICGCSNSTSGYTLGARSRQSSIADCVLWET